MAKINFWRIISFQAVEEIIANLFTNLESRQSLFPQSVFSFILLTPSEFRSANGKLSRSPFL